MGSPTPGLPESLSASSSSGIGTWRARPQPPRPSSPRARGLHLRMAHGSHGVWLLAVTDSIAACRIRSTLLPGSSVFNP
jgi:hypothetical protein